MSFAEVAACFPMCKSLMSLSVWPSMETQHTYVIFVIFLHKPNFVPNLSSQFGTSATYIRFAQQTLRVFRNSTFEIFTIITRRGHRSSMCAFVSSCIWNEILLLLIQDSRTPFMFCQLCSKSENLSTTKDKVRIPTKRTCSRQFITLPYIN